MPRSPQLLALLLSPVLLLLGATSTFSQTPLCNDGFETGTCFQWSSSRPFCITPQVGLRVEVTWETPNDPDETDMVGADLDLHILHPDAAGDWLGPFDCFKDNPAPDWGVAGAHNNPIVILLDDDGAGPETTQVTDPESVAYTIGVHYFDDLGFGASYATLEIRIDGVPIYQHVDKALLDGQLWEVGTVQWPGGTVAVVDIVHPSVP